MYYWVQEGLKYFLERLIYSYSSERMSQTDENANRRTMKSKIVFLEEKGKRIFVNPDSNPVIVLM